MHKYIYGGAAAAIALLLASGLLNSQPVRTANAEQATGIVTISAIEATIDIKALPVIDIPNTI
jgi:hypothetical protein